MPNYVFDRNGALARLDGDEELYKMVIETYVEDIPLQIDNLRKAAETGNAEEVRRLAHSIKGASANIGALAIRDLALDLESRVALEGVAAAGGFAERFSVAFAEFTTLSKQYYP